MMTLTVEEVLTLNTLKLKAECVAKFEATEPHTFSLQEYLVLKKVLDGFNTSAVKVRLRAPKRKKAPRN